ncbi:Deoxyuridine 5'-triphosphate nucleotidohydrolase [Arachis hypogaea]|nr:Deoxyuridine 5'-triphosphate nucleotidohydrolase [Arachis hypogaea]
MAAVLLSDNAVLSSRASPLSSGYDISSAVETKIPARGKALVATDLSISIPEGTYAYIGLALKHSIDVGARVINTDYRGPVGVILFNRLTISDLLSNLGSSFLASVIDTACKAGENSISIIHSNEKCNTVIRKEFKHLALLDLEEVPEVFPGLECVSAHPGSPERCNTSKMQHNLKSISS